MKRCPECRRDYYDDTLLYCLDDGSALLDGPAMPGHHEDLTVEMPSRGVANRERARSSTLQAPVPGVILSRFRIISLASILLGILLVGGYYYTRHDGRHIESIAILPFVNQNSDEATDYLADGIPDSISNSLSQLTGLRVMSRNSVFRYKGDSADPQLVARELNVQAVLYGRVLQRGDGLLIGVELINADDNSKIWGQQYSRKLTDVFAIQEEIAKEISERLKIKLSGDKKLPKSPTQNLKAFQYYSQGRALYGRRTSEDLVTTIHYYEKAINEDSNYALAYSGLADAYGAMGIRGYMPPGEARRKQEEYARKAIELDENLAEAHAALGLPSIVFVPFNFPVGDREMERAIELSPSLAAAHQYLGHSFSAQERLDEALASYLKARELDPLSAIIARNVATAYFAKGEYARALELLQQADELGPPFTNPFEISVYIKNGRADETLAQLQAAMLERPADPLLIYDMGMIYAAVGRRQEALQIIMKLERTWHEGGSGAQFIASIYMGLNEPGKALEWLELALNEGAIGALGASNPVWEPVRTDPRFVDLRRRAGLPETQSEPTVP
jgi:eukaryotic-like serine/threonine-protein kinase